jgi:hypothetical protein
MNTNRNQLWRQEIGVIPYQKAENYTLIDKSELQKQSDQKKSSQEYNHPAGFFEMMPIMQISLF